MNVKLIAAVVIVLVLILAVAMYVMTPPAGPLPEGPPDNVSLPAPVSLPFSFTGKSVEFVSKPGFPISISGGLGGTNVIVWTPDGKRPLTYSSGKLSFDEINGHCAVPTDTNVIRDPCASAPAFTVTEHSDGTFSLDNAGNSVTLGAGGPGASYGNVVMAPTTHASNQKLRLV